VEIPFVTETVSAMAAVLAAVFAWGTMKGAEKLSRSRNTLDLFLAVEARVAALSGYDTTIMQEELLRDAKSKGKFSNEAQAYQKALNILDILAFAIDTESVDTAQANRYLRRLRASTPELIGFIKKYRTACGDDGVYEALETLLTNLENSTPNWFRP
jgi:tellurite resistance protein